MKLQRISVSLCIVMMIVVLHNAIPHHHHFDIPLSCQETDKCHDASHCCQEHNHATCQIRTIDLGVPRFLSLIKADAPTRTVFLERSAINPDLFPVRWLLAIRIQDSPGQMTADACLRDLPPRAPPC